jgi:predicted nucleotidyltransferase component of viral defense system
VIPGANVAAWRARAPWPSDAQVEQDLVLSRALVELFQAPDVAGTVALRGGTALHELVLEGPRRYSEDLDLVQVAEGPVGLFFDAIRRVLDPRLVSPSRKLGPAGATLAYRFETTGHPVQRMRLKIEINTREHSPVLPLVERDFTVENPWFGGVARVRTYRSEELLATKLRALYQRKKGRDLFDLWVAIRTLPLDLALVRDCFLAYVTAEGASISRADLESNLDAKLQDAAFLGDVAPLVAAGSSYAASEAGALVRERLVALLDAGGAAG